MMGEIFALISAILWGFAPILDKTALSNGDVSPFLANLIRSIGALTFLIFTVLVMKDFDISLFDFRRSVILLTAGAIAGGVAMIIYYSSLKMIGAAKAVPITSIYPLFTILFSLLLLKEPVNFLKLFTGTILIVAGLIIVTR